MKSSYYRAVGKGTLVKEGHRRGKVAKTFRSKKGEKIIVLQFRRNWIAGKVSNLKKLGYKFGNQTR